MPIVLLIYKDKCRITKKRGGVMKMKKNIKMFQIMNCLALILVAHTANICCIWAFHQPEFPEAANKFKKVLK